MALKPGDRLGHYEVVSPLGAGGMGEVYRARHLKLGREVALKVLPDDLAVDPERRRRFVREARAASALNHPNIVTVYDIDEADGTHYIAMELVEGRTLRALLVDAPLRLGRLLALARQIAEGLARAHAAGIVHRDLKPGNLMVTDEGLVKILDFGIAKLTSPKSPVIDSDLTTAERSTETGVVLGTVPYMSPEQAAGLSVDFRSDQFSFGAILYEMATGRKAFQRDTRPQTLAAVIEGRSEPLGRLNPRLPAALVTVVEQCLAKRPDGRFASTRDLAAALQRVPETAPASALRRTFVRTAAALVAAGLTWTLLPRAGNLWRQARLGPGSSVIQGVAVLPLQNLSGDSEQEYLADGMTEALITDLAQIGSLKVIGRSSVMRYKGTEKSVSGIAAELGVDAVVEGSAVRAGDQVRVMARLVDARTERTVWAESYERDFHDVLILQRDVAQAIAREVAVTLTPQQEDRLARARAVDPGAYEAYLRGRFHALSGLAPQNLDVALSYFERALESDPSYAPAWAGIAGVWGKRRQAGQVPAFEATPHEEAAVRAALELDDSLPEVHLALASLEAWGKWDWAAAERAFHRALELNPNDGEIRAVYSHFLNIQRRPEEAMRQIERALELDPLVARYKFFYGVNLLFVRRFDDAITAYRDALQISPRLHGALRAIAAAFHQKGMYEEALGTEKAFRAASGDVEGEHILERILQNGYSEGGYREAWHRLAQLEADRSRRTRTRFVRAAGLFLRAEDRERALECLEGAYVNRDPNLPYALGLATFDSVRDDPRFKDLLRRVNLPMWIEEG